MVWARKLQIRRPRRAKTGIRVRKAMVRNELRTGRTRRLPSHPSIGTFIFAQAGSRGILRRPHETANPARPLRILLAPRHANETNSVSGVPSRSHSSSGGHSNEARGG